MEQRLKNSPTFHCLIVQFWAVYSDNPTKPQIFFPTATINLLSCVAWPQGGGRGAEGETGQVETNEVRKEGMCDAKVANGGEINRV